MLIRFAGSLVERSYGQLTFLSKQSLSNDSRALSRLLTIRQDKRYGAYRRDQIS